MKSVAFILSWLLLPLFLYCQTTEFFTADWKKTKNREKASYYRAINYGTNGQPDICPAALTNIYICKVCV